MIPITPPQETPPQRPQETLTPEHRALVQAKARKKLKEIGKNLNSQGVTPQDEGSHVAQGKPSSGREVPNR